METNSTTRKLHLVFKADDSELPIGVLTEQFGVLSFDGDADQAAKLFFQKVVAAHSRFVQQGIYACLVECSQLVGYAMSVRPGYPPENWDGWAEGLAERALAAQRKINNVFTAYGNEKEGDAADEPVVASAPAPVGEAPVLETPPEGRAQTDSGEKA